MADDPSKRDPSNVDYVTSAEDIRPDKEKRVSKPYKGYERKSFKKHIVSIFHCVY